MSFVWGKSDIRMLYKRLYQPKHLELIEEFSDEDQVGHFNITNFDVLQNEIYNDHFILEFVETLSKEDKICFEAFYFGGLNTYKLLAEYLNVSIGTASTIVKELKNKLKQYININTIH
jgi:DNA-directed RNA polymerase specialized sigma subunit